MPGKDKLINEASALPEVLQRNLESREPLNRDETALELVKAVGRQETEIALSATDAFNAQLKSTGRLAEKYSNFDISEDLRLEESLEETTAAMVEMITSPSGILSVTHALRKLIDMAGRPPEETIQSTLELLAWMGIQPGEIKALGLKGSPKMTSMIRAAKDYLPRMMSLPSSEWKTEVFQQIEKGGYADLLYFLEHSSAARRLAEVVARSLAISVQLEGVRRRVNRDMGLSQAQNLEVIRRTIGLTEQYEADDRAYFELLRQMDAHVQELEDVDLASLDAIASDDRTARLDAMARIRNSEAFLNTYSGVYFELKHSLVSKKGMIDEARAATLAGKMSISVLQDVELDLEQSIRSFRQIALLAATQAMLSHMLVIKGLSKASAETSMGRQRLEIERIKFLLGEIARIDARNVAPSAQQVMVASSMTDALVEEAMDDDDYRKLLGE